MNDISEETIPSLYGNNTRVTQQAFQLACRAELSFLSVFIVQLGARLQSKTRNLIMKIPAMQ